MLILTQSPKNKRVVSQIAKTFLSLFVFFGIVVGVLSGCNFIALHQNVKIYEQHVRLSGQLWNPSEHKNPVIVLLYQVLNQKKVLASYRVYHKPDRFQFMVLPGQYVVEAFEDANQDLIYQDTEWAAYYGKPSIIIMKPGQDQLNANLTLEPPGTTILTEFPNLASPASRAKLPLPYLQFGEIITLQDSRFSEDKGRLGLWEPLRFAQEIGGGLYFLEAFDPDKTPVLFIHGAGATPQSWAPIIQEINRDAFQPWLFYYPSGLYLDDATELLQQALSHMSLTHPFNRLIMVAHSMGGLIARAAINTHIQKGRAHEFPLLLITISTPWGGHQAAQAGLDYSPIGMVPSWVDLAPDSPFQKKLFETHLPPMFHHHLLFSYKGRRSAISTENDDGAVSLASQLHPKAQHSATKILGFNEDHTSILTSQEMSTQLNGLFKAFQISTRGRY
jgi:pimeloyl-ACP methyl ester carboxylesterase